MNPAPGELEGDREKSAREESSGAERLRWNRITGLVADAWDMDAAGQRAFLSAACGEDETIQSEVLNLLKDREKVSEFLEGGVGAGFEPDLTGAVLSSYVVESKIGEGGMGVVYLARDTRLERLVAIKTVRFATLYGLARRERFLREARTAAALNHPNVVTIYDVGSAGPIDFIAMEYLAGATLDRVIGGKALPAADVLRYGEQIASALAAAHAKRIIHRDLKPGNIVVAETGLIKVLDFGLAKQLAGPVHGAPPAPALAGGGTGNTTIAGEVAGTASYMSPEQAEGGKLDERSDLFSLGTVLFEMATGRKAFQGASTAETLEVIRSATHSSVRDFAPKIPRRLDALINACLERDPARRPRSAGEVAAIIQEARRASERSRKRIRLVSTLALIPVVLVSGWYLLHSYAPQTPTPERAFTALPLTGDSASEFSPAISPDGARVAFSLESRHGARILVKPVTGRNTMSLTGGFNDHNPAWSPDGRQIAFLRERGSDSYDIYIVPSSGETAPHLVRNGGIHNAYASLIWPVPMFLIVSVSRPPPRTSALYRIALGTGEMDPLTDPPPESDGDFSARISPDGRNLAFVRVSTWNSSAAYVAAVGEDLRLKESPRRIDTGGLQPSDIAWDPSSRELIFAAGFASHSLWRAALRGGSARRLNVIGADGGTRPSVSANGTLVFARRGERSQIARMEVNPSHHTFVSLRPLISSQALDLRPQYSPAGNRISFISLRSGFAEIWTSSSDGSNPSAVTDLNNHTTGDPFWSPDGRFLAFNAAPQGRFNIFKISSGGGTPIRLTSGGATEMLPSWSRDGRWIYFTSYLNSGFHVFKVPSGGGPSVQVTLHSGYASTESPDGKFLYFTGAETNAHLWRKSLDSGAEKSLGVGVFDRGFAPTLDGAYFLASDAPPDRTEVRFWNERGQTAASVDSFAGVTSPGLLSVSPGGRYLLLAEYSSDSQVMVVKGFR